MAVDSNDAVDWRWVCADRAALSIANGRILAAICGRRRCSSGVCFLQSSAIINHRLSKGNNRFKTCLNVRYMLVSLDSSNTVVNFKYFAVSVTSPQYTLWYSLMDKNFEV